MDIVPRVIFVDDHLDFDISGYKMIYFKFAKALSLC